MLSVEGIKMIRIVKNELYKLFARKKIFTFGIVIFVISLLILGESLLTNSKMPGVSTGQAFSIILLGGMASFVFPIMIVLLVTSLVTDEYMDGSLKLVLVRPVKRNEYLLGKVYAYLIIIAVFLFILLILGYIVGTIFFGWGDTLMIKGEEISSAKGIFLVIIVYALSLIPYFSFGMVIMFFAVLLDNSGSTVGIGSSLLIATFIIQQLVPDASPYLISSYFNTFYVVTSGMDAITIFLRFLLILSYGIIFYNLSQAVFKRKDILI